MPWIKSMLVNPAAGEQFIRFYVDTQATPHSGLVGVVGVFVASTATVTIVFRRRNYDNTQSYDNILRIICPANSTVFMRSPDDPFIQKIGLLEAGAAEYLEVYTPTAVTGTVYVMVEVAGGPVEIELGSVA